MMEQKIISNRTALLAWTLAIGIVVTGQDGQLKRADRYFSDFSYVDAIDTYEQAAEKGADPAVFASNLAQSYWKIRDLDNATLWFAKAVSKENGDPEDMYRYSEVLRAAGKYEEADSWLRKYQEKVGDDRRVKYQKGAASYGPQLKKSSIDKVKVAPLNANSANADMAPLLKDGKLYFASAREYEINSKRLHTWNNKPFMEIYAASVNEDGQIAGLQRLKGVNTSYHESNPAFSPDGKTIWFTRNNYHKGKKQLTEDKVNNLKIFSRQMVEGEWADEKDFPFNSNSYSVGHPCLTEDGLTMFFTSNMPGGQGGTDIWMTEFVSGSWSKPTNLGRNINTPGNEMFPFIHPDGTFFFASDGHQGLGGLDIVYTDLDKGNNEKVKNPGAPINSGADDFGITLNKEMNRGYFTTNRPGGKGDDDIMMFDLSEPFGGSIILQGVVIDGLTFEPLENAHIDLKDATGEVLGTVVTGPDGSYSFALDPDKSLTVVGQLEDHRKESAKASTKGLEGADTTIVRNLKLYSENAMALVVKVKNKKTNQHLDGVDIEVIDNRTKENVVSGRTGESGDIRTVLDGIAPGDELEYTVKLSKKGFVPEERIYRRKIGAPGEILVLEDMVPLEVGGDLAKLIDIKPIYFDLNKSDIRPDAATELDKIVAVMNEYPNMVIELGSHTDSRGSDSYNESLSDRRAKSSAAYIVSKGIDTTRITGKGYGEAKLVNHCKNGVKCSKAEHQANRRTEFIIVKM